jgi:hypothetical protein
MIAAEIQFNHVVALTAGLPPLFLCQLQQLLTLLICRTFLAFMLRCPTFGARSAIAARTKPHVLNDFLLWDDDAAAWFCTEQRASPLLFRPA